MFFERLIQICNSKKVKPTPLLQTLGISTGSITSWKNGSMPSADTVCKIADYFDVSVDYLMGRTNEPSIRMSKNELFLANHRMKAGEMDMRVGGGYAELFMNNIIQIFKQNGGKNYIATTITFENDKYDMTITRKNGERTIAEKMDALETENKELKEWKQKIEAAFSEIGRLLNKEA